MHGEERSELLVIDQDVIEIMLKRAVKLSK